MGEAFEAAMAKATEGWRVHRHGWAEGDFAVMVHGKLFVSLGGVEIGALIDDADTAATDWEPMPYVVAGEWRDPDWWALSKATVKQLTIEELQKVTAGPKRHPFGAEAFQVMRNGEVWIYPSKEAATGNDIAAGREAVATKETDVTQKAAEDA